MKQILFIALFANFFANLASAQTYDTLWTKSISTGTTSSYDYLLDATQTNKDKLFLLGHTESDFTSDDISTIEIDAKGNLVWNSKLSSTKDLSTDSPFKIGSDTQGNIFVIGRYNYLTYTSILAKYNKNHELVWTKELDYADVVDMKIGSNGYIYVMEGRRLKMYDTNGNLVNWKNYDDEYIFSKLSLDYANNIYLTSTIPTGYGCSIIKLTYGLTELWKHSHTMPLMSMYEIVDVVTDNFQNIYTIIKLYDRDGTMHNTVVTKLTKSGTVSWQNDTNTNVEAMKVKITGNSQLIIGANYYSENNSDMSILIFNTSNGQLTKTMRYNSNWNKNDFLFDFAINKDSDIFITGVSHIDNGIVSEANILKYNKNLELKWSRTSSLSFSRMVSPDIMFIDSMLNISVVGTSYNYPEANTNYGRMANFFAMKYDSAGNEIYAREYTGRGSSSVGAVSNTLATDKNSNVYGGVFNVEIPEDHGYYIDKHSGYGRFYFFKYNNNGQLKWVTPYIVDSLYSGSLKGPVICNNDGSFTYFLNYWRTTNAYKVIVTIDSTGKILQDKIFNGNINDIKPDTKGNLFIVGKAETYPYYDYVEKYNSKFEFQWKYEVGGAFDVDSLGNSYFYDTQKVLNKLSPNGNLLWKRHLDYNWSPYFCKLMVNHNNQIVITGTNDNKYTMFFTDSSGNIYKYKQYNTFNTATILRKTKKLDILVFTGNYLLRFSRSGQLLDSVETNYDLVSMLMDSAGFIYTATREFKVFKYQPNLELVRTYEHHTQSSLSVGYYCNNAILDTSNNILVFGTYGISDIRAYNWSVANLIKYKVFPDQLKELPENEDTGITTNKSAGAGYTIYPNPCKEILNIIAENSMQTARSITLYNSLGKEVERFTNPQTSTFNISYLESGLYLVRIETNNKTYQLKLLKN